MSAIIAIDFDGTCVEHVFPKLGRDVPDAERVIRRIVDAGHRIMLWTMRAEGSEYPNVLLDAVEWFEKKDLSLWAVNRNPEQGWSKSLKQYAHLYIDDAALGAPLKMVPGFERPVVDWIAVEKFLESQNFLTPQ